MAAFPQHGLGGNGAAGGGMGHGQGNGGGQGGAGQGGGAHEGHGPVGTEYTLQGVMRFLQIEWHAHERARNSWDIERAEMKAKIAKQEGECRQAKRINEQLSRQIKMLESALRAERAKTKAGVTDGRPATPDKMKEEAEKDGLLKKQSAQSDHRPGSYVPHNSFLQTEVSNDTSAKEQEQYLDNTTKHLKNCMQEIQYLLTPPQIPPPLQGLVNGNSTGLPNPGHSPEDAWTNYARMPRSMPSMQGEQMKSSVPSLGGAQAQGTSLPWQYQHPDAGQPQGPLGPEEPLPAHPDEQVETVTHAFDASGRAIPAEPDMRQLPRHVNQLPEADGWTFDEGLPQQPDTQPPEVPPRRPDTDLFPSAANATHLSAKSPPRTGPQSHRRKSSGSQAMSRRRSSQGKNETHDLTDSSASHDPNQFKVRFALRGHLDVVRSVIFSGGGSPSEPEVCTAGDDGTIKRWIVPASYSNFHAANNNSDLDITAYFTHRGHEGIVTSLATCPASTGFSTGGRANGDGWIFSGGQDATVRVWERGRVDPKATLEGHTDTVWCVCVLPATVGAVFGPQSSNFGGPDRLLLVSGSADGTVKVWAVSAPPQGSSPSTNTRRGVGGSRRHSVTSGSNFPSSPQPSVASATIFGYTLIHSIERPQMDEARASPTCICPLSPSGETFVVSYTDSSVLIFDTRSGEELIGMASNETYDGSMATSINAVVATSHAMEGDAPRGLEPEELGGGATGSREGIEGMVISGHEDRFVRFFDANSGQCTYTMLAHPSAISALALSKDGREAVSAGHDASIRFWSLEKRICTQDLVSHRPMRGEGVCDVAWSQDGRLVVSAGGDGVVKVFAR